LPLKALSNKVKLFSAATHVLKWLQPKPPPPIFLHFFKSPSQTLSQNQTSTPSSLLPLHPNPLHFKLPNPHLPFPQTKPHVSLR
jgi:hypothetical protein